MDIYSLIANPTQGKLGEIGQTLQRGRKLQMQREQVDMQREQLEMTQELNRLNMDDAQLKLADTQSKIIGGYSQAVLEWVEANPKQAQDPVAFGVVQKQIRDTMPEAFKQYIPENTQSLDQLKIGMGRSATIQSWLHTEKKDNVTKWEYEQAMIEKKHANPDQWSPLDQDKLDALQREPSYGIPQASPSGDIEAKSFFNALEYNGEPLKNNVENETEYRARLSSRAKEIFGERKKSRDPISMATAFDQAYQESVERGELEVSDVVYEASGGRVSNPMGKKYKFNPNAGKHLAEGMSEARMKASLSRNGLDDTPDNREKINKKFREESGK